MLILAAAPVVAQPASFDPALIERATGMKPTYNQKENVYKITMARQGMSW
jgi:hypothetical protein